MNTPYLDLYRRMLRLRLVEKHIAAEYPQQNMRCPVHLSLGQEAVAVGAGMALQAGDVLLGSHRSHGPYVAMGGDVYSMLAELHGKADGCCAGKGGSMHLAHIAGGFWGAIPIVGSAIPIATGVAQAFALRKEARVSMVFFGDGATEEGVFHESLQWAKFKNLPVVYVCENNRFSVNTPWSERRPHDVELHNFAKAHGLWTRCGDGNDVFSVHQLCVEAAARAREQEGPAYLEFETYRLVEHCGPYDDHHLPCRSNADLQKWTERCPLQFAERFLLEQGLVSAKQIATWHCEENAAIAAAMNRAKAADFPSPMSAPGPVYAGDVACAH